MAVNIPGLIAVVVFYIAILVTGIVAGRKTQKKGQSRDAVLVADRNLGMLVSVFTVTATLVGGGYINGSAESAARDGLVQTQAPVGYCISLMLAAFTYAPKMREAGYVTMFDPFALKWGKKVAALLFIVQLLGDLFWCAATLAALGATIAIILDINATISVIISAAVAIIYTFLGGLYSVAYTDVIQLVFIAVGLVIAAPFTMLAPAVDLGQVASSWQGSVAPGTEGAYLDTALLCIFGGIPWQALFQRVLACKDVRTAKVSTFLGGLFSLFLALPGIVIGVAGASADWNQTDYTGEYPFTYSTYSFILPLSLQYLCPLWVSLVGIGSLAAAVMSSADSTILSASSVFAKNVYADILRPQCSERELLWVLRISILVVGSLGTLIAIFSTSIYGLYVLCADLMYVILFPQLTCVLYVDMVNAYGSVAGFFVSLTIRVLAGEPIMGMPPLVEFPLFNEESGTQMFPHRTLAMVAGAVAMVVASWVTNHMFIGGLVSVEYDVLKCHLQRTNKMRHKEDVVYTSVEGERYKTVGSKYKDELCLVSK